MSVLFSPLALRNLTLSNRIVVAAMCQYSAVEGLAQEWHLIHIATMALSGAGMLCLEATAVEPAGRITPGCLGLWDDGCEAALRTVVAAAHRYTATSVAIQLAHAGRKASSKVPWEGGAPLSAAEAGWMCVAPSAVPQHPGALPPAALDRAGMDRIHQAFVSAAQRAVRLGVDAVELHAAHGYLLHEFFSPISNRRDDAYGGSIENRMRFPLEIFDAVRAVLPAGMPLGIKVSATDWVEGGWTVDQTIVLAHALRARGLDWIDVSSGGISPAQAITTGLGYQVPFAAAIRRATGLTTIAVGEIDDPHQAEAILTEGKADLVALARGMLFNPRWPWHAAAALQATIEPPPQYQRAAPARYKTLFRRGADAAR